MSWDERRDWEGDADKETPNPNSNPNQNPLAHQEGVSDADTEWEGPNSLMSTVYYTIRLLEISLYTYNCILYINIDRKT